MTGPSHTQTEFLLGEVGGLDNEDDDDGSGFLSGTGDSSVGDNPGVDGSGLPSKARDSSTNGELDNDGFRLSARAGDSSLSDEEVSDGSELSPGVKNSSAGKLVALPSRPSTPNTGGSEFTGPPLLLTESLLFLPSSLKIVKTAGLFESMPEKQIRDWQVPVYTQP